MIVIGLIAGKDAQPSPALSFVNGEFYARPKEGGTMLSVTGRLTRNCALFAVVVLSCTATEGFGDVQQKTPEKIPPAKTIEKPPADIPQKVDVVPQANDSEIQARLLRILEATGWYADLNVKVDAGVVYLSGVAESGEHKEWAGKLAGKTQDVVAVVNRIEPRQRPIWDFSPAWNEVQSWSRSAILALPLILLAAVLLVLTWLLMRLTKTLSRTVLLRRVESPLLQQVAANVIAVPVLVVGVYLVLKISGLAGLAVTIIGGTGLFGLVIGIAFRDIAENFLASVLISVQRPFRVGDLIKVESYQGYVQRVTTRGTLLMMLDGNHVQIPNAVIYKNTITNFTSNPNVRLDFPVGIGFDASISKAQEIAVASLNEHPAVLNNPEPIVLVEELGAATVNLRCYFWTDGSKHSQLKVKSSVIRIIKKAFESAGISMPDASREIVFPNGVPVSIQSEESTPTRERETAKLKPEADEGAVSSAEGGLHSEANEIEQQARQSRSPDEGANLLDEQPVGQVNVAAAV